MNECSVLILSCDNYSDLWKPFSKLFKKYWGCPYETYIATETKESDYFPTIKINEQCWTKRIRESLKRLNTKYVIIMCDDFFIRNKVDQKRIEECIERFDNNIATFNFEKDYMLDDGSNDFRLRKHTERYLKSCQAGIWDRLKLIELLNRDKSPWEWEESIVADNYKFYINTGDYIIDYGYKNYKWFGIRKGKWIIDDVKPLFEKENIEMDYSVRGIYEED